MDLRLTGTAGGPPVLLLHGQLLDAAACWDGLEERLARRRRVLAPDLPGYGGTAPQGPGGYPAVRAALEAALGAAGVGEADVVGCSAGCWLALALALEGRLRVRRLYLLGALAGLDAEARATFSQLAGLVRTGTDLTATFLEVGVPAPWATTHPEAVERVRAAMRRVPAATVAADFEATAALPDLRPRLGEIRCPVLLRAGDADRNTPLAWSEAIASAVPGARLEVATPGVGHLYLVQDREATVASIERFLG